MLLIGLTGGIGSGKSRVCELFSELGVPIIDSDLIAHQLVEPHSKALTQIAALFGSHIIQSDGSLDRAQLREDIFNDKNKRQQLEEVLHPLIRKEMLRQVATVDSPYVILAIPLLLEKNWQNQLDRVLVVDCSETQQLERASKRDNTAIEAIEKIIASQINRNVRINAADDIIDNRGSLDSLRKQVESLHHRYLRMAANY